MTGRIKEIKNTGAMVMMLAMLLLVVFVTEIAVMELFNPLFSKLGPVTGNLANAVILVLVYAMPLWYFLSRALYGAEMNGGPKLLNDALALYTKILAVIFLAEFSVMLMLPVFLPGAASNTRNVLDAGLTILCCAFPLWRLLRPGFQRRGALLSDSLGTPLKMFFLLLAMLFFFDLVESQIIPFFIAGRDTGAYKVFDSFMITLMTAPFLWMLMVRPLERAAWFEKSRFDAVQAQLTDAFMVIDGQGIINSFNPAAERIFGHSADEIAGKSVSLLLCDEEKRFGDIMREATVDNGRALPAAPFEVLGRRRDGDTLFMEVSVSRVMMGAEPAFLLVMRDMTDRKMMETDLRNSEIRFRGIFEQTEDAVFFINPGTTSIIDVNPAAEKLWAFTGKELREGGLDRLCSQEECDRLGRFIGGIKRGETSAVDKITCLHKNGREVIVSARGKVMTLQGIDIIYCSFRDITKRVRMEEETREMQAKLIQANKMASLGLLVSGVAHEINNPNNFIMATAQLLAKSWEDIFKVLREYCRENGDFAVGGIAFRELDDSSPKLFEGIIDGSRRIDEIIGNLKGFARRESINAEQDVDINRVAKAAVSILHHEIAKHSGKFHLDLAEGIPHVRGSGQQLGQVVINLLMNACQALPVRDCGIVLATGFDAASNAVTITVRDEGRGMAKNISDRIFEPFFTTKLDSGGTGLGLSISQSIIRDHDGTLEFESEPGVGTTFHVKIPALHLPAKELRI